MSDDKIKRSDQIAMLKTCLVFTDTGKWEGLFTYPNCGWDLVQCGLVTDDKKITKAGRAALWLLGDGADPTTGASFESSSVPIDTKAKEQP